ncbi:MAG TPA: primosomal protein N' [Anaerolineales bacterium]|nr:primosomal protein N' [Anaerolineales bacterium]
MATFVQIVVNVPAVSGIFDYAVPESLLGQVGLGHLVIVPFGKQTVQGVIFRFIDRPSVPEVKEVADLVDPEPVLTQAQIALAEEMAEATLSSLASVVGLFLPAGLGQEADVRYELRIADYEPQKSSTEARLIHLLKERGPLRGRQIDTHFRKVDWRKSAGYLIRRGVLVSQSVLPPARVRPKFIKTAQLAVSPDTAEVAINDLGKTEATQTRREKALRFLMRIREAVNVSWIYAESGGNLADLQELAERGLIRLFETEVFRDPLERARQEVDSYPDKQILQFTSEQQFVWEQIEEAFRAAAQGKPVRPFLLQGVTGSGKTEIYIRAAQEAIRHGKQAIILVPEIALTPQTVRRFLARFPGQVGLVHSKLSEGERYDTWRRARAGSLKLIIGPRSALFAPLPNIGLIVADECHDASYYQSEPPFYHAVTAAQAYSRLTGAVCILGSATPTVVQRYQTTIQEMNQLDLPNRVVEAGLPPVQVVDMREELKAGQRGIFSRLLLDELASTLGRGEQVILFLNRRGTATYVFCRDCGHVLRCPNCDMPLTYHIERQEPAPALNGASNAENRQGQAQLFDAVQNRPSTSSLRCHHCGYERAKPRTCPSCGSRQIREYGLGSERVEAEVSAAFPGVRTLRWDWETTRQKDSHEMILTHFAAHRADVLVGTQMLAKGLDLPLVTLVGIVLADVGLYFPDPFAGERVFQVLTQVAGRAGRSERGGRVVMQTFDPANQVIRSAARHDVSGFYQAELEQRRRLGYPPFSRLVRMEYRHQDPGIVEHEARRLASRLGGLLATDNGKLLTMIGPVPCFFAKIAGYYRWQIVLRGADPAMVLRDRPVQVWLKDWRVEVDPISLL